MRSVFTTVVFLPLVLGAFVAHGATFVVATDADSGPKSLRDAITLANANGEADEIVFDADYTIMLSVGLPHISSEVTIRGNGWGRTILDGTNSGWSAYGVLGVFPSGSLVLDAVTVRNSQITAVYAAGELLVTNSHLDNNFAGQYGGAIGVQWEGAVTVRGSTFTNNWAFGPGGAIGVLDGSLEVSDSTFSQNYAGIYGGEGGAIGCSGGLVTAITNSTFSGNQTDTVGGALYFASCGTPVLYGITITGNRATTGGSGVYVWGSAANLSHSILDDECAFGSGGGLATLGHNLESGNTCGLVPALGDLVNVDPLLGPLEDNGGPTATHLLARSSPAVDGGAATCGLAADQRGYPRPVDGDGDGTVACDIGAVEVQDGIFADGFESGDTTRWSGVAR